MHITQLTDFYHPQDPQPSHLALLAATCSKIGPAQAAAQAAAAVQATQQPEGGGQLVLDTGGQQIIVSGTTGGTLENWVQLGGGATTGTAVQVPVVDSSGKQQSTIALNPQLLQQTPQVSNHQGP